MNKNFSPNYQPSAPKTWFRKILPFLGITGGLCALFGLIALAGYYIFAPEGGTWPVVMFQAPQNGDQFEVGQVVTVRALARDPGKITRVELWVDGQLHQTETSNLPDGISPFPILASWQPLQAGNHTVMVRAFNNDGRRTQAIIQVDSFEFSDRDDDGIADDADACPDQLGSSTADGCIDRDGDSVPDANDACPDETGLPEADGCPVAGEADRDGDGILDETDTCPDTLGPPTAEGCPDSDVDTVPDAEDACPEEAGWPDHDGCPTPGDADGDGILDDEDACPEERGPAGLSGCPDSDGDGVPDSEDAAPRHPGPADMGGAPDTDSDGVPDVEDPASEDPALSEDTDRDDDGAPDFEDRCPDDWGLPEDDFCPDSDGAFFEVPLFGLGELNLAAAVEFEAVEFKINTGESYDQVWCYARLGDGEMERFEFTPWGGAGTGLWNIQEHLGNENSRTAWVELGERLLVFAECSGFVSGSDHPDRLGYVLASHPAEEWTGNDLVAVSEPNSDFQVRYRICSPNCDEVTHTPPLIMLQHIGGLHTLSWLWEYDESINGFKLYRNSNYINPFTANTRGAGFVAEPACGERWEFHMTTYGGADPNNPDWESPPSNVQVWEGESCPRIARVTFTGIQTHDFPPDDPGSGSYMDHCGSEAYVDGWGPGVGPIVGSFYANGVSVMFDTDFDTDFIVHNLRGVCLEPNRYYTMEDLSDQCHRKIDSWHVTWRDMVTCPDENVVTVDIIPGENLTFGGSITNLDQRNVWYQVYNGSRTLPPPPAGATGGEYTISDDLGYMDLIVNVEILSVSP